MTLEIGDLSDIAQSCKSAARARLCAAGNATEIAQNNSKIPSTNFCSLFSNICILQLHLARVLSVFFSQNKNFDDFLLTEFKMILNMF